jgi:hypothetical protein
VFSGVERQGPGCPEFFGVAQVDGLRAGDSHEPGTCFRRDLRLTTRPGRSSSEARAPISSARLRIRSIFGRFVWKASARAVTRSPA